MHQTRTVILSVWLLWAGKIDENLILWTPLSTFEAGEFSDMSGQEYCQWMLEVFQHDPIAHGLLLRCLPEGYTPPEHLMPDLPRHPPSGDM